MLLTQSMLRMFCNCRRAYYWRYVHQLVPAVRDPGLSFGSLIHECLEQWHRGDGLPVVLEHIDQACATRRQDPVVHQTWHLARAMMTGYTARYPTAEDFEVVELEKVFEGQIVDSHTGSCSPDFVLAGKVDGIVRQAGEHHLIEHKTASSISGGYLERLWTDFQVNLYTLYARETLGIPITGVIYNILVKARLRQGQHEPDASFQQRLETKFSDPAMFHRERLYISRDQLDTVRSELWELTRQFTDARDRGVFSMNTDSCWRYGRTCEYLPLCRSGGNPNLIENMYERRPPHEELDPRPRPF